MSEEEIKKYIIGELNVKLEQFGINKKEIKKNFDFVQSGLLDSMGFVEMLAGMEKHFGFEIDFESIDEDKEFTTLNGIYNLFLNS